MSTTRDPDVILAAWLDEGPTELPDITRRAILTALPTTPQARRGRFAPRNRSVVLTNARLVAGALVTILAVGTLLAVGSRLGPGGPGASPPGPSPTVAPSPTIPLDPSAWIPFTSRRHGISVRFPAGWTIEPATAPWIWQAQDPGPSDNAIDRAIGPASQAFFISSQRLPDGKTEAAWWADYLAADTIGMPPGCFPPKLSGYTEVVVAGELGYLHGGLSGCNFTEAIVIVDGRAYQLTAYVDYRAPTPGVFDRPLFDAWLSTVVFEPTAADDSSVAPSPGPS
jgi:hypothetical protein